MTTELGKWIGLFVGWLFSLGLSALIYYFAWDKLAQDLHFSVVSYLDTFIILFLLTSFCNILKNNLK